MAGVLSPSAIVQTVTVPEPGVLIEGKYRLAAQLSASGPVVVFGAKNVDIERDVHVKTLRDVVEPDDPAFRALMREALAVGSVAHQNVQSVLDSGMDARGMPFIVFEALSGTTLGEWMKGEGLLRTEEEVTNLIIPLLEGLSAVHDGGVVHRAIGKRTIMLKSLRRGEKLVKLTDFSHAVLMDGGEPTHRVGQDSDLPMEVKVPPAIQGAPEPSWDVFAAGCLAEELLTDAKSGRFFGSALMERVIRGATAPQQEERYPNARIMLEAATILHETDVCATWPAPTPDEFAEDGVHPPALEEDLRFLKLRRDTNHGRHTRTGTGARVQLMLVLLVIEFVFKSFGEIRWRALVEKVPRVEGLLPGSGNTEAQQKQGIEISLVSELLAAADELVGNGDLGFVAGVGERISERAVGRLLPDAPGALSPGQAPALFPRLWRAMTRQGRATVLDQGDDWALLGVMSQDEPSLEFTALVAGLLKGLLRSARARDGGVQVTACEALGDQATVFRLSW